MDSRYGAWKNVDHSLDRSSRLSGSRVNRTSSAWSARSENCSHVVAPSTCVPDPLPAQYRPGHQRRDRNAEHPLRLQCGLVAAVEGEQVVQVKRLLGTGDETAVLATVRQVRASPEAVGHDLVEEDVDAVGIAVGVR